MSPSAGTKLYCQFLQSLHVNNVGVGVLVGSGVGVSVGTKVGVSVGAGVGVSVGTKVGVLVGSGVGVAVATLVGIGVGVGPCTFGIIFNLPLNWILILHYK